MKKKEKKRIVIHEPKERVQKKAEKIARREKQSRIIFIDPLSLSSQFASPVTSNNK